VAGIIGAVTNNGEGIAGVAHVVQLMAVRIADADGLVDADVAIAGIGYAMEKGAHIMNNSWGGTIPSFGIYAAVSAAQQAGITFVASAGNDGLPESSYPARYGTPASAYGQLDNVIAVMATDRYDQLATFSNYGPDMAHLGAPGVDILSTTPLEATDAMIGVVDDPLDDISTWRWIPL
jgi:subtilisin family serine protease